MVGPFLPTPLCAGAYVYVFTSSAPLYNVTDDIIHKTQITPELCCLFNNTAFADCKALSAALC